MNSGGIVATALERHYRPDELAEIWGLSVKVIRQIFVAEPGVLKVDRPENRNKRGYCTMRIPESVVVGALISNYLDSKRSENRVRQPGS